MNEWKARIFGNPPVTLIQDDELNLYIKHFPIPDIYIVATWIRNLPQVYKMVMPNPLTDVKQTRKYIEYRFMVFPF